MFNANKPEFKKEYSFDSGTEMSKFSRDLSTNPLVSGINQVTKHSIEVVARQESIFDDIDKKLTENSQYDTTEVDPKKKKYENPLSGKGYPYNEEHDCEKVHPDVSHDEWMKTQKESVELDEAPKAKREKGLFTAVAIEVNDKYPTGKFAGNIHSLEKNEFKTAMQTLRSMYKKSGSKINVAIEDHRGKVVKVFKESVELAEDGVMIRELELFIANDGDLYRQIIQPIIKNYRRKINKGIFDEKLAAKGFMYAVTAGIKKYNKEFGSGSMSLNKKNKEEVALMLLRNYRDEIREGVHNDSKAADRIQTLLKND